VCPLDGALACGDSGTCIESTGQCSGDSRILCGSDADCQCVCSAGDTVAACTPGTTQLARSSVPPSLDWYAHIMCDVVYPCAVNTCAAYADDSTAMAACVDFGCCVE